MNRKKPKTSHIGRHFIKAPQTMAWSDSQHRDWINSAGLGLDPQGDVGVNSRSIMIASGAAWAMR
jgi:hypothetical protein